MHWLANLRSPVDDHLDRSFILLSNQITTVLKFLTSRPLWVNMIAGVVILFLLLFIFLGSLDLITKHGKTMKIPLVTGKSYSDARKMLENQGFDVQIQDSIYYDTVPALQVIRQFPEADNQVKINRTVYLTINRAVPPMISMPNLVSMTFRNADMVLKRYGLKLADTVFKPDFAKNSVLDQMYNGESIKPGTSIKQGSAITLVLGNGVGMEFIVPDLFGLTYREARAALAESGLIAGSVVPDHTVTDTLNAFVKSQSPSRIDDNGKLNHIRQGEIVDLWLTAEKPVRGLDSSAVVPSPPSNY
ncbi:MAG: penicillin-binding protein [Bacteroidetes bacterium]|nr:MAG: penicillin-binding protein [Bacteroidota bacterium]